MAIKGKSRKRSKPKPPALPPRPAIGARKTPLAFRKNVKRTAVIVLALLAFLGGLRVWQNVARADALRKFNQDLSTAQSKFIAHFAPNAPSSFDQNLQAFTQGQIGGSAIIALATLWETDFRSGLEEVSKIKPPNPVAEDAQFLIEQGIDGYIGVVRLLNLAGQVKLLADAEKDPKQKQQLNDKVQVTLQQADEWRKQRADVIYTRGAKKLDDLNVQYGITKRQSQQQQQQQQQQQP